MASSRLSRRKFIRNTAAATAVATAAPYIKAGHSAGSLAVGLWDHWVPGVNEVMEQICAEWGAANNVDIKVDFITSIGNKLLLTAQAEARAETGHDVYCLPIWFPSIFRNKLVEVDDLIAEVRSRYGEFLPSVEFLAHLDGVWRGVPAPSGSPNLGMVSRLDLYQQHAGIDLRAMFPAGPDRDQALVDSWTYDKFLSASGALFEAGVPFGAPIAPVPDATNWIAPIFASFGADLISPDGDIVVDSDATRDVLEYMARLTSVMDQSVYAWDDAGNNRWLISGRGAAIVNPPSAWAVARRDNPEVGEQLWHHDMPRGPNGRYRANAPFFWGIWDFSDNIPAAKDFLLAMSDIAVVDKMTRASQGYDLPLVKSFYEDNDTWTSAGPPEGVLYNYPVRGDEILIAAGYPAMPEFASLISTQGVYPNLVARYTQGGDSMDDVIGWAENELEGLMRG